MAVDHYENFPVASILLPRRMRRPVEAIYRFARSADDFADEGDLAAAERIALLRGFHGRLDAIAAGQPVGEPLFAELAEIIRAHALPIEPFYHLLDAFEQDVVKSRYADLTELLDYCRRSANPIGRLLLHLYGAANPRNFEYADAICSGLQLINFWQDIAIDFRKGRVYLPQDDMARFGVSDAQIARGDTGGGWRELMKFEIARTRELLYRGAPLGRTLAGRIGVEMRMIIAGGDAILAKLLRSDCDMFRHRPVLRAPDWVTMLYYALMRPARLGLPQ